MIISPVALVVAGLILRVGSSLVEILDLIRIAGGASNPVAGTTVPTSIKIGAVNWSGPFWSGARKETTSLNVTGPSKVVTKFPIESPSSDDSTNCALSKNVSSPVIALILRLPIYKSPLEFRPV